MADRTIPVQIKTPSGAEASVRSFVVGIGDLVPIGYDRVRAAEDLYKAKVLKWRQLAQTLRLRKSDPRVRWRLGDDIDRFFSSLKRKYGIVVTNQLEALSYDLSLSHDALGFILRVPNLFTKAEVAQAGLSWSKFQEIMGITDATAMRDCFNLLKLGKIRYDKEIRAFKRAVNRRA